MGVRDLFDAKADQWAGKYAPGGPLAGRLVAFGERLARLAPPPARVLDFGCGAGNLSLHLVQLGYAVIACDLSAAMIAEARRRDRAGAAEWTPLVGESEALPYGDGSVDAAVASSVLEYVPDPGRVLAELARVLRPGGPLVFSVPDPRHPVRRIEAAVGRVTRLRPVVRVAKVSRRASAYLEYLRLSRNRFDVEGWRTVAAHAGLVPFDSPVAELREPLRILCFRRALTR